MLSNKDEHLNSMYKRYWSEICIYIRKRFGSGPPEPEDVAQTVFTRYAAIDNPFTIDNPRAYLYRIASHIVIDCKRREAVQENYLHKQKQYNDEHNFDLTPESVVIAIEELNKIEAAIKNMPTRQQHCLLLHRIDGLSFAEIARKMKLSGPGVRKIILKAMKDIDQALNG